MPANSMPPLPSGFPSRLRPNHVAVQGQQGDQEHRWLGVRYRDGIYGTGYLNRALVTAIGLGANRIEDACYPTSQKDVDGKDYLGSNKYVMHFPKGQLPPVGGFWSLTMYDENYFFVDNPINRYWISARQNLKSNPDGSVDLYIQKESPGADKEWNWLPAPAGKFVLMLRLYWPNPKSPSIIDRSWSPPPQRKSRTTDRDQAKFAVQIMAGGRRVDMTAAKIVVGRASDGFVDGWVPDPDKCKARLNSCPLRRR